MSASESASPAPAGTEGVASFTGETAPAPANGTRTAARPSYRERKEVQRRHRQLEKRILTLEERQEELGGLLSDPAHASDYELLVEASDEAAGIRDELARLYPEWESLAEVVAALDDEPT